MGATALTASLGLLTYASPAQAQPVYEGLTTSPVITGLNTPVNFDFAPDGKVFVAEKSGIVKVFDGPGDTSATQVIDLRGETYDHWDRGLLGLTIDPKFSSGRPYIYLLLSYDKDPYGTDQMPRWGTANGGDHCATPPGATDDGCTSSGLLLRYTVRADGTADPASRRVLLDGTTDPTGGWCHQFPSHSIGDVQFGPDGMLYVGSGDAASFNGVDYGQYGGSANSPRPANPVRTSPVPAALPWQPQPRRAERFVRKQCAPALPMAT